MPTIGLLDQRLEYGAKNLDSEALNGGSGTKIEAFGVKMGNSGAMIGKFETQIGDVEPLLLTPKPQSWPRVPTQSP